ncbi:hypothetical protein KFL_000110470 [Klebsormidium nitens]|uniref:Uncharacterized protein n=1 Tax=Klebsormidium nitens TaxID=105231 RepID=A0A1Y1HIM3_KLENI|nr:hypothetical protein KFL_000110470 [Klebsormidium nitens]|eukprot:GAQ78350.1 hypothetical protein KFL_000110470 [Klebsormidium nitens]
MELVPIPGQEEGLDDWPMQPDFLYSTDADDRPNRPLSKRRVSTGQERPTSSRIRGEHAEKALSQALSAGAAFDEWATGTGRFDLFRFVPVDPVEFVKLLALRHCVSARVISAERLKRGLATGLRALRLSVQYKLTGSREAKTAPPSPNEAVTRDYRARWRHFVALLNVRAVWSFARLERAADLECRRKELRTEHLAQRPRTADEPDRQSAVHFLQTALERCSAAGRVSRR